MQKLKAPSEVNEMRLCLEAFETARPCISVCAGSGCKASGAGNLLDGLRREVEKRRLGGSIDIKSTGCHGFCEKGPVIVAPLGVRWLTKPRVISGS
jgi:NADH-quinone oxidoreductase subunit F